MLNRGLRRRTRPSIVPANENTFSPRLGDTRCNRTHTRLRHELNAHIRIWVGCVQIKNQLL